MVVWFTVVVFKELFVNCSIVVVVVATGCGTAIEGHADVAGPRISHVLMAMPAVVRGNCQSHHKRPVWNMFLVTGQAVACIQNLEAICVGRVVEFGSRVSITCRFQLIAMTVDAGVLHHVLG